jgi:hypothetical protein
MCPLCGIRRSKRACPALGQQICPVCCGTKRLVEIQCPSDCPYLAAAREHPAAVVLRQHERDVDFVTDVARDFSERQSQLFVLVGAFLGTRLAEARSDTSPLAADGGAWTPHSLMTASDDDVLDAVRALAATYETSARGVIYDHRPASAIAQQVVNVLKPLLTEVARESGGTSFDRDAAVVLRRFEQAIVEGKNADPQNRRRFLDLMARLFARSAADAPPDRTAAEPRLIVP